MKTIGSCFVVLMLLTSALVAAPETSPLSTAGGRIASIDAAAKSLVVKVDGAGGGQELKLLIAHDSKIVKGSAAVELSALNAGDQINVTYKSVAGQNVVVNIGVSVKS